MVEVIVDANKEKILKSILFSEKLPAIPAVAARLITMLGREDTEMAEVAELISMDVSMSTKLLKIVNSAYYSFPNRIDSINQAVNLIGTNAVQNLVLSVAFFSLKGSSDVNFDYQEFWHSSLARAVGARLIFSKLDMRNGLDGEKVFLTGLLQNLGKLILASTMNEQYLLSLSRLDEGSDEQEEKIELECFGVDHPLASYSLTREWGFPDSLVVPLRYHHAPDTYTGECADIALNARICYLADILSTILSGRSSNRYHQLFRHAAVEQLNLSGPAVNSILKTIHIEVDKAAEGFGVESEATSSIEDILMEANIKLSLLNMSYDEMNRKLVEQQIQLEKLTRELADKNKILENLAYLDGLTGVNNHRYFQNFLDLEVERGQRDEGSELSLLMMDIDRFKLFNDTYGHKIGDFILKEFCVVVADQLRENDLLARYGGEEFVVVLPGAAGDEAISLAEKIRLAVEQHIFADETDIYRVTISIGVASGRPADSAFKKDLLITSADEALYQAKNGGRNRVVIYRKQTKKGWFS